MFRFEKKYILNKILINDFLNIIKSYPFKVTNSYPSRYINNIYFDTLSLKNFYSNISGERNRKKYRLRWYGSKDKILNKSFLEIKIKNNNIGTKKIYTLENINVSNINNIKYNLFKFEIPSEVKYDLKSLYPTLSNKYLRHYFLTHDGKLRITIDEDIIYYSHLNNTNIIFKEYRFLIIELKFDIKNYDFASELASLIPIRVTKYSKYVNGLLNTNKILLE